MNRRVTLPVDWVWRRAEVATRAGYRCEWPGWLPGRYSMKPGQRCAEHGSECDHITDRWNHDLNNLQWLCSTHHSEKTQADARTRVVRERRPRERHPGLRG